MSDHVWTCQVVSEPIYHYYITIQVSYGDEDIKSAVNLVATIISNFKPKIDSELAIEKSMK